MLLIAWAIRRPVLPDISGSAGPAGAVRVYYARHYVPADLLNLKSFVPACERGKQSACTELAHTLRDRDCGAPDRVRAQSLCARLRGPRDARVRVGRRRPELTHPAALKSLCLRRTL